MYSPANRYRQRYRQENFTILEVGEGFKTQVTYPEYLDEYGLLGKGVLSLVNELCTLVADKKDELPEDVWNSFSFNLSRLMVIHDSGELYYYLIHAFGPDAINYNAWVRFASDSSWPVCVRTFADMPTHILEEYGTREWRNRTRRMARMDIDRFLEAISTRSDIYGSDSLPIEMVETILFYNGNLQINQVK